MIRCTWKTVAVAAALAIGSASLFVRAADDAKPATGGTPKAAADDDKKPAMKKPAKLVKPWSELKSLSDEQSEKIVAIHRKALDEINAIKDKEEKDITALLSDAQKAELKAMDEADTVAKKAATPKKEKAAGEAAKPAPAKAP